MAKEENWDMIIEYVDDYFPRPETGGKEGALKRMAAREKALEEFLAESDEKPEDKKS